MFRSVLLNLVIRIQRVGLLSLASLLAGGTVLILFALNVKTSGNIEADDIRQGVFRVGSQLSVQSWLAVLGITFGMLSWQARRAGEKGLEYARYLNSQPQAPVLSGLYHGFPVAVLCRYLVAALAVAASVGYKFVVVIPVTYGIEETLPLEHVQLRLPPLRGIENGTASPWLAEGPLLATNRAFFHYQRNTSWGRGYDMGDALRVPFNISMVGWANCTGLFNGQDHGVLVTREIIMVASMTEESGQVFMTSHQGEWARIQTSSQGWINGSNARAVIDYRIVEPGKVQIQWTKPGSWTEDAAGSQAQPVERRLTYDMNYAVAEVRRRVRDGGSCSHLSDENGGPGPDIMARSLSPIKTRFANGSVPLNLKLIEAILYNDESGPREGVSAFVRGVMAGWAAQLADMETAEFRLGHAPAHAEPFGEERTGDTWRVVLAQSTVDYPWFTGFRVGWRTGCYLQVAEGLFAAGILAIILAVVRIVMGPPLLTSWMGQHVHLALIAGAGEPTGEDQRVAVLTGYGVARRRHLGALKLVSSDGGTEVRLVKL